MAIEGDPQNKKIVPEELTMDDDMYDNDFKGGEEEARNAGSRGANCLLVHYKL
jgi:hypothetical protein